MILFKWHIALMSVGSALVASATLTAATQRRKRWWLGVHRAVGLAGVFLILAGDIVVVAAIVASGGEHFRVPHTWVGGATVFLAVATPILGFMSFRVRRRAVQLRLWHRLCGRLLAGAVLVTVLFGLHTVGLL